MSIGVKFDLEAAIGQLTQGMGKLGESVQLIHKWMTANPRQSPLVRPLAATGISDGSTYFSITLGGPVGGRVWDLRRIAVWPGGSTDPFAQLSGVTCALVRVNTQVPNKGSTLCPPFTDLFLASNTGVVPDDATFSAHEATIRYPEVFVVIFKGTANNQQLMVTGQAEEYIESSPEWVVA